MKTSKCIGIDVGYGFTKVITDSEEGDRRSIFPSVVGNCEDEQLDFDGLKSSSMDAVEIDGQKLLVGRSALKHSMRLYNAREKDWIGSPAYKGLMKYAIQAVEPDGIKLTIVSGLPVSYYKADRMDLANLIREISTKEALTVAVKVIPQPLGSFFSLLFDNAGEVRSEELMTARVGVLDIGFYTSDLLTVDNLEPVAKQVASFENGVAGTLESIARDIEEAHAHDLKLDPHGTEEAVRRGTIKAYGEVHDIMDISNRRLAELAAEIHAKAKTVWKSAADIDKVLLSGGGAALLKDHLELYRHSLVIEEPQFANAIGYYRYARRIDHAE